MKIKLCDRAILLSGAVLAIIGGVTLFVAGLQFEGMLRDLPLGLRILCILIGLLLAAFGGFIILFPRLCSAKRSEFVVQKTENGELRIAVKAIENLVRKCTELHEEMEVRSVHILNSRDGVVIELNVSLANNISIPLAIAALQKQIKQYLIASSGIEVKEVRVSVESTQDILPPEIEEEESENGEKAAPVQDKKLPLHQRLFGRADQPAIVPEPPREEEEPVPVTPEIPAEQADSGEAFTEEENVNQEEEEHEQQ